MFGLFGESPACSQVGFFVGVFSNDIRTFRKKFAA
jgi:hypothetical protein